MKSAFISHSWHDKRLAKKIAETLQRLGAKVWLDDAEIKLGDSLIEKIRGGIDSVDYVIALISDKSVSSAWVTKELDIAMNQEIAGRRVKVLPILASKCSLPGFLTGKLYADMSTPRAFQKSLPILLDRLDAPANLVSRVRAGKAISKADRGWLSDLMTALASGDTLAKYHGLKTAPTYKGKDLLTDSAALEAVFSLLDGAEAPYIKIRALQLVCGIEDDAFAYRIEPLLSNSDPSIASAAIDALAELGASESVPRVLDLFSTSPDLQVRNRCLRYFSRVRVRDEIEVLSFVGISDRLLAGFPDDEGLKFGVARAFVNQLNSRAVAEILVPRVTEAMLSSSTAICAGVLDRICEMGEELYIPYSPDLRSRLAGAILKCGERREASIAAAAWTACLLLTDTFEDLSNRKLLWQLVAKGDDHAVEHWLDRLGEYRLEAIFDKEIDADELSALVGKFNSRLDDKICDALCELQSDAALAFLSKSRYEPRGWGKIAVLRNIGRKSVWDPALMPLVQAALEDLPEYSGKTGKAWALIVQYKAGIVTPAIFVESFPGDLTDGSETNRDVAQIAGVLKKILENTTSKSIHRKLGQIVADLGT